MLDGTRLLVRVVCGYHLGATPPTSTALILGFKVLGLGLRV